MFKMCLLLQEGVVPLYMVEVVLEYVMAYEAHMSIYLWMREYRNVCSTLRICVLCLSSESAGNGKGYC